MNVYSTIWILNFIKICKFVSDPKFVGYYNKRLNNEYVKLVPVLSFRLCLRDCYHSGICKAVNYDKSHLDCYFLDVSHTNALTSNTDYIYAYITSQVSIQSHVHL